MILGLVALLTSFSRSVLVVFLFSIVLYLLKKKTDLSFNKLARGLFFSFVVFSLTLLLISPKFLQKNNYPEEVEKRLVLTIVAKDILVKQPLFGVGLNNYIVNLTRTNYQKDVIWSLQPVHNIFLLVLVETGVVGLMLFVYLIVKVLNNSLVANYWSLTIAILAIVATGLTDHYWLTLQQNQFLFSLVLGLVFKKTDH
jgi:O-antigen ligase